MSSHSEAAQLGQVRGFVLNSWRIAHLPITTTWFPRLDEAGNGALGRAPHPKELRARLEAISLELATPRPEVLTKLGPLRG